MNCEETIKVSAMVDGELTDEEMESLKAHIGGCQECSEAEAGFVFLRNQIRGLAIDEQTAAVPKPSFFRRRISIPAPAFAIGLLVVFGLLAGLFLNRTDAPVTSAKISRPKKHGSSDASLARFDNGGIARIYKEAKR